MYRLLAALLGVLTALMITLNGALAHALGNTPATTIIHLIGLLLVTPLTLLSPESPPPRPTFSRWLLVGGAAGFLTVACANASLVRLDVSLALALSILGQSVSALLIDHYGWLGARVARFQWPKLASLALILAGIVVMALW